MSQCDENRSAAIAALYREIREVREARLRDSERIRDLEVVNGELWEVVAFLWAIHDEPKPHRFREVRFRLSALGAKLQTVADQKKEGRK